MAVTAMQRWRGAPLSLPQLLGSGAAAPRHSSPPPGAAPRRPPAAAHLGVRHKAGLPPLPLATAAALPAARPRPSRLYLIPAARAAARHDGKRPLPLRAAPPAPPLRHTASPEPWPSSAELRVPARQRGAPARQLSPPLPWAAPFPSRRSPPWRPGPRWRRR